MIMPHCKECEHSMEMVRQACRSGVRRCELWLEDCEVGRIGRERMQSVKSECKFSPKGYNMLEINRSTTYMYSIFFRFIKQTKQKREREAEPNWETEYWSPCHVYE